MRNMQNVRYGWCARNDDNQPASPSEHQMPFWSGSQVILTPDSGVKTFTSKLFAKVTKKKGGKTTNKR